jgi:WD40 repeat protein
LFSPVDKLLAYSIDYTVKFWRSDGSGVPPNLVGHSTIIEDMVFSPNGGLLASVCSQDGSVWDVSNGTRLYYIENTGNSSRAPLISLDGRLFAWRTADRTVSFWLADSGDPHGALKNPSESESMVFAPHCQLFACASSGGIVDIWDTNKIPA